MCVLKRKREEKVELHGELLINFQEDGEKTTDAFSSIPARLLFRT